MLARRGVCVPRRHYSVVFPSRIARDEYAKRRTLLQDAVQSVLPAAGQGALILLKGSGRSYLAPDVPHTYRQCSHFRYVTGIHSVPGCSYVILIPPNGGPCRKILFADQRTEYEELWEGRLANASEMEDTAGFDDLLPSRDLDKVLRKMASRNTVLYTETDCWTGTSISLPALRDVFASVRGIYAHVDKLRLVKSSAELQSMDDTCSLGARMMTATIASSFRFQQEGAIVGLLEFEARRRGAERLAYPPVVAAGDRANTIHYMDANHHISEKDCVLVDAGCDLNGYVSDITRCWPLAGEFLPRQREVYEALRSVHEQLLEYAHSMEKVRLSSLFRRMVQLIAANMLEIGMIPKNKSEKEILQLAEDLCPHHVSHYLGMDVHDCASVSRDIDLPEGVVFTIEPGVYIPASSTSFPREFRGMGFRIEDDVVTTSEGVRVLTTEVPRSADDIECLMKPV